MAKSILIDEFHLTVFAPANLPKTAQTAAIRTLKSKRFQAGIRKAVADSFRRYASLRPVKFTLSR
jgi:hypothetical protein